MDSDLVVPAASIAQEHLNLYKALLRISRANLRESTHGTLCLEVCRAAVESGSFLLAWIGWHDRDRQTIVPAVQWGSDVHQNIPSLKIYPDERPEAYGPAALFFRTGKPYVCNEFLGDPSDGAWRAECKRMGIRAAAAFRICPRNGPRGAFMLYAREADFFQAAEIALLREAAADISYSLEWQISEDEHGRETQNNPTAGADETAGTDELSNDAILSKSNLERRVSERTQALAIARDRAESADRRKSSFLTTMSHELRTPLNTILGFTGILLKGMAGPVNVEQSKQLGMVQSSARHLLLLINDVLDISKIEAGQLEIHRAPFDVRASVEKILAAVTPAAEKKALHISLVPPLRWEILQSDQRRVEQVLLNLLNNAVKFTEHGEIEVRVEFPDDMPTSTKAPQSCVRFRIRDTGIGIEESEIGTLFKPFRQIDSGTTRQLEGTGLGLAISRRLAEMLGGEINVRSQLGSGSEFIFTVPHAST
jgi:signal transduction histidine kinase